MAEHFSLRWNNFHRNMSSGFRTLLMEDSLVDVTLAADGHFVQAHRLVLSVCSPYFKNLFSTTPCSHPIVVMKDVHFKQLTDILSFMYQGEVNVRQEELADFLKTAELLQIRGLAEQDAEDDATTTLPQPACLGHSEIHSSKGPTPVESDAQPRVRVNKLGRASLEQILPSQQENRANKMPSAMASNTIVQTVIHQSNVTSPYTSQGNKKEGPSTPMFVGVQVKEELPEVPSDVEENVDTFEYLPNDAHVEETNFGDTPNLLSDGALQQLQVTEKQLSTVPPALGGTTKFPAGRPTVSEKQEQNTKVELPKIKRPRKQRKIAISKIRRFLVTPKRSRRIAFARKMKMKKQVILKSGLTGENVSDVSKRLPVISRNSANLKNAPGEELDSQVLDQTLPTMEGFVKTNENGRGIEEDKKPEGEEENIGDKEVISRRYSKEKDSKLIDDEDSKKKIVAAKRRKVKSKFGYRAKKYRNINSVKNDDLPNDKQRKLTSLMDTKNEGAMNKEKATLKHNNKSVNKKNILVVIASKKSKSAVALARRIRSPVRGVQSRHGSIERTISNGTVHLRSSVAPSNSSLKDSSGNAANGQSCRHSGCVGCQGGN